MLLTHCGVKAEAEGYKDGSQSPACLAKVVVCCEDCVCKPLMLDVECPLPSVEPSSNPLACKPAVDVWMHFVQVKACASRVLNY